MAVIGGALADLAEAVFLVEGDGGGVGLADFQEEAGGSAGVKLVQGGEEEGRGDAGAAVGPVDGYIEEFSFVGGLAGHEEAGDFLRGFANEDKCAGESGVGWGFGREPVHGFGGILQDFGEMGRVF
jgi:hypothetical protein